MAPAGDPVVLLATTNAGKTREIRRILGSAGIRLLTLADVPSIAEPEETGHTFKENAVIKAFAYGRRTGLPTVAEDSGLAIDALGGRPGVESARYPGATYGEKFANLYRELASHPRPWTARFVCSLVFLDADGDGPAFAAEEQVDGEIAPAPAGTSGFGYDPIFLYPPYGCTFGEVTDDRKLAVAHRGKAFRAFAAWLASGRTAAPPADRAARD